MNINDISNGSEVKIHASINGHSLVLMTEAIFGVSAGLLVKPMEYFGKYMQFLEPSQIEIRNKRDGRIYKFMSTTITPVKTRYGNFHLIRCSSKLEPKNSRKSERFYIDKLGLMSINGNTKTLVNCIVHDLSMRGISVIVDKSIRLRVGDRLDIMFRYGATLHSYEVSTIVVRHFMVQDKNAVGCAISNLNVDLISLLTTKRREKYPELIESSGTDLNPEISESQQIEQVEQDLAAQTIPARNKSGAIRITDENPFAPERLEHVSAEKTLRQKRREERQAREAEEIANLLDLRNM